MNTNTFIREFTLSDLASAKKIIDENKMFPSEYLDEMVTDYINNESKELWFVAESKDKEVVSIAYCAPEMMTEGTWNLLLIAVSMDVQGQGIGGDMMAKVEQTLTLNQARILLVETSSLPEYQLTRQFYPKCGYKQVAVIPEYYGNNDDKVVFWKLLN